MNNSDAKSILMLQNLRDRISKNALIDNIEYYLYKKYPRCEYSFVEKIGTVAELTGDKFETAYAWFNRSRKNAKIPFIKLCRLAAGLNVDVAKLLITD